MKQDDFERLKDICEREGFEVSRLNPDVFQVNKKDPWEGVEFVECIEKGKIVSKGRVYKVLRFLYWYNETGISIHDDTVSFVNMSEKHFKPSTETAYVDQLKKEAFERFGEIKEGDRFDFTNVGFPEQNHKEMELEGGCPDWKYFKESDRLLFYGWVIYQQGKWAERVKERIKVEFLKSFGFSISNEDGKKTGGKYRFEFGLRNKNWRNLHDAGKFLASQLEKYLNGEIE